MKYTQAKRLWGYWGQTDKTTSFFHIVYTLYSVTIFMEHTISIGSICLNEALRVTIKNISIFGKKKTSDIYLFVFIKN